jgi:hypothetical protein
MVLNLASDASTVRAVRRISCSAYQCTGDFSWRARLIPVWCGGGHYVVVQPMSVSSSRLRTLLVSLLSAALLIYGGFVFFSQVCPAVCGSVSKL